METSQPNLFIIISIMKTRMINHVEHKINPNILKNLELPPIFIFEMKAGQNVNEVIREIVVLIIITLANFDIGYNSARVKGTAAAIVVNWSVGKMKMRN